MELKQLCNIHGMLVFNRIEEDIIRHPTFNRLADIKQLGYTYKAAYKCATHTRLSHSLGVSHLVKEILKYTVEKNREYLNNTNINTNILPTNEELNEIMKFETLLSAAALLHDINHIPFAHTIQTHLKLNNEIIQSEKGFDMHIDEFSDCQEFNTEHRENVKNILIKSRHSNFKFAELFYTLIRCDIGASTIDFIQRDHHEAGHRRIGLFRVLEGFIFVKIDGKIKIALDLISSSNEILTSIQNLLFNRYKLAATIYFHKHNISAEAMVGKSLRYMILYNDDINNKYSKLDEFIANTKTDYHFYLSLEQNTNINIKELGKGLEQRNIYDIAFSLEWSEANETLQFLLCEKYRGRDEFLNMFNLETIIAKKVNLEEKEIIIYCCDPYMYGFDIDNFLVLEKEFKVTPFKDTNRRYIESEYDSITLLKKLHKKLWKFYVLCKRENVLQKNLTKLNEIKSLCENSFKDDKTFKKFLKDNETLKIDMNLTENKKLTLENKKLTLENKKFLIALSFPGEKREYVKEVLKKLTEKIDSDSIFYDQNYTSDLAKPDSDLVLQNVYKQSKLNVLFLCKEYSEKEWCGLEFRVIREMIKIKKSKNIMFIKFDDVEIEGILSIDGYIDAREHNSKEISNFIIERIEKLLD